MSTIEYELARDAETIILEVDYTVEDLKTGWSCGQYYADGGEIVDLRAFDADTGREVALSKRELEELEQYIYDTHDYTE